MASVVSQPHLHNDACLPQGVLDQLARTFESALQAVWVHDQADRCVYRNPAAIRCLPGTGTMIVEDILDYRNCRIGTLRFHAA